MISSKVYRNYFQGVDVESKDSYKSILNDLQTTTKRQTRRSPTKNEDAFEKDNRPVKFPAREHTANTEMTKSFKTISKPQADLRKRTIGITKPKR